jgi:hypothetical protein
MKVSSQHDAMNVRDKRVMKMDNAQCMHAEAHARLLGHKKGCNIASWATSALCHMTQLKLISSHAHAWL